MNGAVRLWRTEFPFLERDLTLNPPLVEDHFEVSPDGTVFAGLLWKEKRGSGYDEGLRHVGLWNASDGGLRLNLGSVPQSQGRTNWPTEDIVFSPDGQFLAAAFKPLASGGAPPAGLVVWRVADGKRVFEQHSNASMLAFRLDGRVLATATESGDVEMVDLQEHRPTARASGSAPVSAVALSPDNSLLASGHHDGLKLHRTVDGALLCEALAGHVVVEVAFSPDGRWLATGSHNQRDSIVRLWRVTADRLEYVQDVGPGDELAFSPDGASLAIAQRNKLRAWSIKTNAFAWQVTIPDEDAMIQTLDYSADSRTIVSSNYGGNVRLWSAADGQPAGVVATGEYLDGSAANRDGSLVAVSDSMMGISVWPFGNSDGPKRIANSDFVDSLQFTLDDSVLIGSSRRPKGSLLRLWRVPDGTLLHTIELEIETHDLVLSDDGKLMLTAGKDGSVNIWGVGGG